MAIAIPHIWVWFVCCLGVTTITTAVMMHLAKQFVYLDNTNGEVAKFSVTNLEWPTTRQAMVDLVKAIGYLPATTAVDVYTALRKQLYVDFIFMPATYAGIFLLCMAASYGFHAGGGNFYAAVAWLQAVAWLCDIAENLYILYKIRFPFIARYWVFAGYRLVEVLKWGISLTGFLSAVAALVIHVL